MADQFGTQTVENFYSPTSSNPKNPGFANLYTSNLMDVKYAFGGLFEEDVAEDTVQEMLLDGVINMVDAVTSPANKDDENVEWSKSTETYGTSISTLDLTGFDFSHVPYLKAMFANCVGLKTIKFGSNLNTENLYDCNAMFVNCENLGPIFRDCVENWNKFTTTRVEDFDYMFYGCSGIEELDISNLSTENAYT
ncbi:MAG: BspA family leucine-rich repeat surface protein [Coriobacteriia bacterium]|nr:BspA family leucine-rich repeat surface protein [Coriobacteriia bacterium]